MKITSVKGFRDVLPDEAERRRAIVEAAVGVLRSYGFREIELPLLERGELFSKSVGATSDIVEKEMYAFTDRDGTLVALRPEGTASVARAYIEGGLARSMPVARLYYVGPMFRRERPQKGRFRQFSQIGAELIGRNDPAADAETICLVADLCAAAGVRNARIDINSLGDAECRPRYREALVAFGRAHFDELCQDCRTRMERNPLRLLDCKNESCRAATESAPMMLDYLCAGCRDHHDRVLALLAAMNVVVTPNPRMVRGLDYYCRTAFEVIAEGLGAQDAVGGGGRYDGLIAELGGPEIAGIGFACGIERMDLASAADAPATGPSFLVIPLGEDALAPALALARRLRQASQVVELGEAERKLKAQLKRADKSGARWVVIIGEDELRTGRATVRDMATRTDLPSCFALEDSAPEIMKSLQQVARTSGAAGVVE